MSKAAKATSLFSHPLVGIAAIGAGLVGIAGLAAHKGSDYVLKRRPYVQQALNLLHEYPPADEHLGKPITIEKVHVFERAPKFHFVGVDKARIKAEVSGPNGTGTLYIWARHIQSSDGTDDDDDWKVLRLDLRVDKLRKRWKFYEKEPVVDDFTQIFDRNPPSQQNI